MHDDIRNTHKKTATIAALFAVGILGAVFLFCAAPAHAAVVDTGLQYLSNSGLPSTDVRVIIARIIRVMLGLVGFVFFVLVAYGGYLYMTAQGQEEKINKAKATIRDASIGLLIMASAYSIVSFIIGALITATIGGGAGGGRAGYGSGGGALGGGIIESHYPGRNATNIPRNTSIVITFKEAMDLKSLIVDSNANGIYGDCVSGSCDLINSANVRVHRAADANGPYLDQVKGLATVDAKTLVYRPLQLLGSPTENTLYTVELTPNIKKQDGSGAFGNLGSYQWGFEVSTLVDLTPPQVSSVIPLPARTSGDKNPRNAVVQINFNEAINPLTIRGVVTIQNDAKVGQLAAPTYDIITGTIASGTIGGEFFYSNQYRTVEFITNDPCGINSCGEQIFCLPGNETISFRVRAAALDTPGSPTSTFPYTGVVDMADNSLDGNRDGKAVGSTATAFNLNDPKTADGDDLSWRFNTNDKIDLEPPEISSVFPQPGAAGASPVTPYEVQFSKLMMTSTLKPDSGYGDGYCACTSNADCVSGETCSATKGYCVNAKDERIVCTNLVQCKNQKTNPGQCVQKEHVTLVMPDAATLAARSYPPDGWAYWIMSSNNFDATPRTTATIMHEQLGSRLPFFGHVGSSVKDLFQNCFQPCAGPGCQKIPKAGGAAGEYVVNAGHWLPDDTSYPICDLSQAGYVPVGNFTINYTGEDGTQHSQSISAFGMNQSAADFYGTAAGGNIAAWGAPFSTMQQANRTFAFLYQDATSGTYYFTTMSGIENPSGAASTTTWTLTGAGSLDTVNTGTNVIEVKDDSTDTYNNDGTVVSAQFQYSTHPDGMMVNIGTGTTDYSFTAGITHGSAVSERVFFFPGGSVSLAKDVPFTITYSAR